MGHFYQQLDDGAIKPRHYTGYAKPRIENGQEVLRPSTVSDLRKWLKNGEKVAPSVTTILDVLAKPGLVNWQIDMHLEQAHILKVDDYVGANEKGINLFDDFKKEVKRLAAEQMDKAPKAGTDFHALMETFLKGHTETLTSDNYNLCSSVFDLICEKTGISDEDLYDIPECLSIEENIFSDLGYAGQMDLGIFADFAKWDEGSPNYGKSPDWVID